VASASAYTATAGANTATFFVVCPAGQIALGGGGSTSNAATLLRSGPTDASGVALTVAGVANGWSVTYSNNTGKPTVWVICSP
jgi:phage tail tape-measure protein